ncbi:Ethylene-responsive transcription factor ERF118 [Camellia lanceoleosa]|nr:Ethylene-responsive transcription factor ERF118 [Camellia lanceoleosa]
MIIKKVKKEKTGNDDCMKPVRRVRVVYNDPYATILGAIHDDYSIYDNNNGFTRVKRVVMKLFFQRSEEKWGKYTLRRLRPNSGEKVWLGTYNTAEEAAKAYERKKLEFEKVLESSESGKNLNFNMALIVDNHHCASEEETSGLFSLSSPSCVLDVSPTSIVNIDNSIKKNTIP